MEDKAISTFNVSLVGVGGQGIILTADILAKAAALAGYDVKKSEIHGMAQRGGSVMSEVRFGSSVASPIIQEGRSDVLVCFDKLEAVARSVCAVRTGFWWSSGWNPTTPAPRAPCAPLQSCPAAE